MFIDHIAMRYAGLLQPLTIEDAGQLLTTLPMTITATIITCGFVCGLLCCAVTLSGDTQARMFKVVRYLLIAGKFFNDTER